jgi:SsrA-binding protein
MLKSEKVIKNAKAYFEYTFEYEVEAGIVLKGDETKSLRVCAPSLKPSYCYISKGEIFVRNLNLAKAAKPERDKKLLLHKKQINKILGIFSQKCFVIVPIQLYEKKGFFKLLIAAGKTKNKEDKREAIKEKEMKKESKIFGFNL